MENRKEILKGSHERIEEYFDRQARYDFDYYERRYAQVERIKNLTKSQKKKRKEKRDEHYLELV